VGAGAGAGAGAGGQSGGLSTPTGTTGATGTSSPLPQLALRAFSLSELPRFPMRLTCLDAHCTVSDLGPSLRTRLWRYLYSFQVVMAVERSESSDESLVTGIE
jgi:hypothetical protein